MDYMERAKIVMGTDRLADLANSPRVKYVAFFLDFCLFYEYYLILLFVDILYNILT